MSSFSKVGSSKTSSFTKTTSSFKLVTRMTSFYEVSSDSSWTSSFLKTTSSSLPSLRDDLVITSFSKVSFEPEQDIFIWTTSSFYLVPKTISLSKMSSVSRLFVQGRPRHSTWYLRRFPSPR
ncbi:hypothetical protein QYF36_026079 [Acer negundo]|nr:hypothetical protein QYF36_026079 [Acer negundo]